MLGRRALQPINFICKDDSAIESGYEEYQNHLYDYSKLVFKENIKPTIFKLRQLTDQQKDYILSEENLKKRAELTCRMSMIGIENFLIIEGDNTRNINPIEITEDPIMGKLVSKEWFHEELGLSFQHVAQIYLAIDRISEASIPL